MKVKLRNTFSEFPSIHSWMLESISLKTKMAADTKKAKFDCKCTFHDRWKNFINEISFLWDFYFETSVSYLGDSLLVRRHEKER